MFEGPLVGNPVSPSPAAYWLYDIRLLLGLCACVVVCEMVLARLPPTLTASSAGADTRAPSSAVRHLVRPQPVTRGYHPATLYPTLYSPPLTCKVLNRSHPAEGSQQSFS